MASSPPNSSAGTTAFPTLEGAQTGLSGTSTPARTRTRDSSGASSRSRSISQKFLSSAPPLGFTQATGEAVAKAPSIQDIRRGSYANAQDQAGWRFSSTNNEGRRRSSLSGNMPPAFVTRTKSSTNTLSGVNKPVPEEDERLEPIPSEKVLDDPSFKGEPDTTKIEKAASTSKAGPAAVETPIANSQTPSKEEEQEFPTGYHFPPKHTWGQATKIALKASWRFVITPVGFLITIYGLNVVAWGGMLFLLLIPGKGSQFMCYPTCDDINSSRRKWIEIDSQILNALFCVTGLGLIPWRFRDLYYLMQYRIYKNFDGVRRLAGLNRGWFRLEGSQEIPVPELTRDGDVPHDTPSSAIPLPEDKIPDAPLTGIRAPPTKLWKLDFIIWAYVANTAFQICLCGFMWGLNRYNRPSWSTGLFIALACIVAAAGGLVSFFDGKKVKKIEGVPWGVDDVVADIEGGNGKMKSEKKAEKRDKKLDDEDVAPDA